MLRLEKGCYIFSLRTGAILGGISGLCLGVVGSILSLAYASEIVESGNITMRIAQRSIPFWLAWSVLHAIFG